MELIVPWRKLCRLIEPHYPKGGRGRPPIGIDRMLRIYFLQVWFNLSDPAVEDALYDSAAMRDFVGIDLGREPAPDETTICKFRHLIEAQGLGEKLFAVVNKHLSAKGIKVGAGTIMDATIIAAPSSTKNADGKRDPEMHQTKKGNQWYFGMKAHIGVDSKTKIVHTVTATPANVHDSRAIPDILHGDETRVWGDSAYQGQREVILKAAPRARISHIIAATALQHSARKRSPKIAPSRASAPMLSIHSAFSNACSDSAKSAIAVLPRTSTVCRSPSRSSICI
jgi:IS5 family transposase